MKRLFVILGIVAIATAQQPERKKGPRVFISGNGGITLTASGVAVGPFAGASGSASKHDQTMEMAEKMLKKCPEITITVERADPNDYELLLNRETIGWFNEGLSQVMLLRASDKTVLYATKKGTVAKAVREGCKAIMADWKQRTSSAAPASTTANGWWKPSEVQK
jgi:hypothetical protein